MLLFIAFPFILISFIMGKWAKKNPEERNLNRFILLALAIACLSESIATKQVSIVQSSFILALSIINITNFIKNKYFINLLKATSLCIMLAVGYLNGLNLIFVGCAAMFTILSYYALNNLKSNIVISLFQIVPVGIAGIYLANDFIIYLTTFMTLFGCVRYFIENKQIKLPKFFINCYLLIMLLLMNNFTNDDFNNNFIILLAGSAFMILAYLIQEITKNKQTIMQRLICQNELSIVLYLKIFAFNIITVAIAFVIKLGFINLYYLPIFIITVLGFGFIKLWYLENEYNR
jgi:hypothetical protein